MFGAIKNLFVTAIAGLIWVIATAIALTLVSAFTVIWYVFFGAPVFGDFLGFVGSQGPATPATAWTLIFVGVMFLLAAAGCYLIVRSWNQWRRQIGATRRRWLGLS